MMKPDLAEKIARVLALDAEATKGPWLAGKNAPPLAPHDADGEVWRPDHATKPEGFRLAANTDPYTWSSNRDYSIGSPDPVTLEEVVANRDLIAEYRTAAPLLATALLASESAREELAGKVGELEGLLETLTAAVEAFGPINGSGNGEWLAVFRATRAARAHIAPKPTQAEEDASGR